MMDLNTSSLGNFKLIFSVQSITDDFGEIPSYAHDQTIGDLPVFLTGVGPGKKPITPQRIISSFAYQSQIAATEIIKSMRNPAG